MLPNSAEILIEPASDPDDFAACARMMVETDPWITLDIDYDQCLKAFEGPFKEVFVLKLKAEPLGFVIMQTQGTFKGYIQTLCISRDHRGTGYGTRLLMFCQNQILQYSPNIFICVSSFNKGAIRLYTKFGFELVGELKDFVKLGFNELLMRKTFGAIADFKAPI
jgi:[ribosomal protein S18]-alanine N-acetyltransferase